jgi:L-seryl-tRNA(Ser) seleniumtransferase
MAHQTINELRDFPSIEELVQSPELKKGVEQLPRPIAVLAIQQTVDELKVRFKASASPISRKQLFNRLQQVLAITKRRQTTRLINASGILVHTNLGRSPLPEVMLHSLIPVMAGYANVEFDLESGKRGGRGVACEEYLAHLAGAESGTVVNNCAAALFIILNTLAPRKKVILSRGELIQIGGGFRIPEILRGAGAKLCEVGTTNITTLEDYESAIDDDTSIILKVHKSNFVQSGFTQEVSLADLVALGRKRNVPVVNDLGSGVFVDTKSIMGYSEPTVQDSVRAGADLTCFSADKLLGASQAGLIVGGRELVAKLKKNPLFRTMRADKLTFALLESVFGVYLSGNYSAEIPVWQMLSVPESDLYKRGKHILAELGTPGGISVEASKAYVGGGALPESQIQSVAIVFAPELKPERLLKEFRALDIPIIGRIENARLHLDLKAVAATDYPYLLESIRTVLADKH